MSISLSSPEPQNWNTALAQLPGTHILQTWEWASLKQNYGWTARPCLWQDERGRPVAAAMVLTRSLPNAWRLTGLRVMYVPKGPICDWNNPEIYVQVFSDLAALARKEKAIFIKMDADVCLGTGIPGSILDVENPSGQQVVDALGRLGWCFSREQVQFRNTVVIDLSPGAEAILAGMKQKTRYNIRLASRKGVSVRQAVEEEFSALYRLYAETSVRDGFVIRDQDYYLELWSKFLHAGMLTPLAAIFEDKIIAGLMLFHFAGHAWYIHGMSSDANREKMPNYLLQWEAIQIAANLGCKAYDLWGAPDSFDESDGMWGVYKFKEGLGGEVVRHIGAWDFPVRPQLYQLYTQILPGILESMRRAGRARTKSTIRPPVA